MTFQDEMREYYTGVTYIWLRHKQDYLRKFLKYSNNN